MPFPIGHKSILFLTITMAILINAHLIKRGQTSIPFILYFHKNLINERTAAAYFFRSIKVPTYTETHGKAEDSPLLPLLITMKIAASYDGLIRRGKAILSKLIINNNH